MSPASSDQWTSRPLWGVLSDAGLSTGIVRWPLTHPAQPARGFVVSDRFHQVVGSVGELERAAYPPEALPVVQAATGASAAVSSAGIATGFLPGSPESAVLKRDLLYARIARSLQAEQHPRFLSVRYEGLDVVGHHYLRYTQPPTPRGVPEAVRRSFAQVIERYYAFIDAELGAALDGMHAGRSRRRRVRVRHAPDESAETGVVTRPARP